MLSSALIQNIPNKLNGRHVGSIFQPCKNWDVLSFLELCRGPWNMGLCSMLQHEVTVVKQWHNNCPQDLESLCLHNGIDKMRLCLNHNPNATISKPPTHQWKKPSKCLLPSDLRVCPSRLWQQTADRSRRACEWASPRWCMQKFFGCANRGCCRLAGWHVVCSCEASWMYCQILWNTFGDGALMDIPAACQQHALS